MKRLKVIACEIMFRELCLCASKSPRIVDFSFMEKGLHDLGADKMSKRIQGEIDNVDCEKYDAIALVYGLCNNGIIGLHSQLPMIVPRAHDCITFLFGSKDKYSQFFDENPGTYFSSAGWIEREINPADVEGGVTTQLGMNKSYEEYVEEFGEENAEYIMSILGDYKSSYKKLAFINTGVGDEESYRNDLKNRSEENNWKSIEVKGDTSLMMKLVSGDWNENDFLIVPPNKKIIATNDKKVIGYN